MTWLWVVVLFSLLYCARRWSRRRYSTQLANAIHKKKRPRRRHRPGDGHRRKVAHRQARELLVALASGQPEPGARTAVGVALQSGEMAYGRTTARLETWSTTTTWVTETQVRRWGRRARSVTRELTAEGWRDNGEFTWLLTSARALGRSVRSGELVSIWWASLASADVDARREVVVINMGNGSSGRLSGPGVLPIAVLVAATLDGMEGASLSIRPEPARQHLRTCGV